MSERFERNKRSVRLTERDLSTIRAAFEARYLTNRMVCNLFYGPSTFSWCKQRMRYLFDGGYLKKRLAYPNEPDVYFLGLKGRRYIASLGQYPQEEVDKIAGVRGDCPAPMLMMNHELTLSSLYVKAALECREQSWSFRWKNTRMLELEQLGIEPDAYLCVGGPSQTHEAFVEFTGVVPTRTEMKHKLERYEAFLEEKEPIPVLWLTTSRNKLMSLRRSILKSTYTDYFVLGLVEDASGFLTRRMWWWSESVEPVQFIVPTRQD